MWRTYTPSEAQTMAEDGSIVTNAVFARNASAMFNPSAAQEAQWETLAKYIPAVSSAMGKTVAFDANNLNLSDEASVARPNGWGRNHPRYGSSWLHSDVKNMAYWYVFPLYKHLIEALR